MKTYTITQHPIKLTIKLDDEWLRSIGVDADDMDELAQEWESQLKEATLPLHALKAQMDASEKMKGTPATT